MTDVQNPLEYLDLMNIYTSLGHLQFTISKYDIPSRSAPGLIESVQLIAAVIFYIFNIHIFVLWIDIRAATISQHNHVNYVNKSTQNFT